MDFELLRNVDGGYFRVPAVLRLGRRRRKG